MSSLSTIQKMADVICRVVFLLFVGRTLAVSSSQNAIFYKKTQPLADPFSGVYLVVLTLLYRISQTSFKVGQR